MTHLSRRQFLAAMAAMGAGTFLAACTSDGTSAGDTSPSADGGETTQVLRVGALGKAASAQRDG